MKKYGSKPAHASPLGLAIAEVVAREPAVSGIEDIRAGLEHLPTVTSTYQKDIDKFLRAFEKGRPLSRRWGKFAATYRSRQTPMHGSQMAQMRQQAIGELPPGQPVHGCLSNR